MKAFLQAYWNNRRKTIPLTFGGLLLLFALLQLVPVSRTNPPVTQAFILEDSSAQKILEQSCYDCHSNETVWGWYTGIAPGKWLIVRDVEEGRSELNFSEWNKAEESSEVLEEVIEVIEEGEMPPLQYILIHPDAKLTEDEKQTLIAGFNSTLGRRSDSGEDDDED